MFSAGFISGSGDFAQDLTSGVLILMHSADACAVVMACASPIFSNLGVLLGMFSPERTS